MFWLVAPSVVAISSSALLAAGCAKGRDDAKRPRSSGSNRASNKHKQSGKSSRKPGAAASSSRSSRRDPKKAGGSSKSSRRDPKAVGGGAGAVRKSSSRSKREGGSSRSGRSSSKPASSKPKPLADAKKSGPAAGAVVAVGGKAKEDKSGKAAVINSKRRSEKDKREKKDPSVEGSKRSSRSKRSSSRAKRSSSSRSKRSSKSKKSAALKAAAPNSLQLLEDKTQEMSTEDPAGASKKAAGGGLEKKAVSPMAVSVTKLELAPVAGVAKQEVRVEPSELRWQSTGGIQNVAVYNHSNTRKALKIKCSDNLLYRVNPVHTFIPAGGSVRVDILRQNGTAKVDKIVLVAADAGKDEPNAREVLNRSTNTDMMVLPLIATAAN